ncbi:MAG: SpoIVB peptidase [Bacilli bacterium]
MKLQHVVLNICILLVFSVVMLVAHEPEVATASSDGQTWWKPFVESRMERVQMPLRALHVAKRQTARSDLRLVPGGQSIGVQLSAEGVLIVGHHTMTVDHERYSPGVKAGLEVGDTIVSLDGQRIKSMDDMRTFLKQLKGETHQLTVQYKREGVVKETKLSPIYDEKSDAYRLGIYVKDSAVGIGTLTFVEPQTKTYGALGHVIADVESKKPIPVGSGHIVESIVVDIDKGKQGTPGEKLARFRSADRQIGTITTNSSYGIFGKLVRSYTSGPYTAPIPIALSHEVKEGKAQMLTVIHEDKVEAFEVEIVSSIPQSAPGTKGMVVRVTDPRLLEATGGIVQGMSGSPLIQDGKIIGAVTHVFVNDPTSGYGVHIEWMLKEAKIPVYDSKQSSNLQAAS